MELTLQLTGVTPLLMHRDVLVDPLHPITREYKVLARKRTKTEDDIRQIYRLEWEAALYHDSVLGPYVPGANVVACIRDAGKLSRQGSTVNRAVVALQDKVPVTYDGPRGTNGKGTQEVWDANLKDIRSIRNSGAGSGSVMRCRPMFPGWSLEISVGLAESLLDPSDLRRIVESAGEMIGLGDYRPRFGRFEVA